MPIYTYKCQDCEEEFDLLIGVSANSDKLQCQKCGSGNIKRIFSSFGVSKGKSSSSGCSTFT
ncbi:MAG: zinc ribbon domain-containing protein [Candidatus Zixiibacteriota bacterium]